MDLIIVESPTKAKTLSRFLGAGYSVEATKGHLMDLPKSTLGIDIEHNFKPEYVVVEKKEKDIKEIKSKADKAVKVYIATDPDREGEAIASHVKDILLNNGTKQNQLARIVFHEITKNAVEEAISSPRDVDVNLVDAQVARRVLDRLVGYKLSPLLWKKVRRGLSAGRVQSVAVRLIVEREKEIQVFKSEEFWEIFAEVAQKTLTADSHNTHASFIVQLAKIDDKKAEIHNKVEADAVLSALKKADYSIYDVVKKEVRKNPFPPFTTSTMSQASARLFSWSAKKTMSVAQKLYEEGHITYHRTDSTNIASIAIDKAREFITKEYGSQYLPEKPRHYKTTAKVAQEAHEAIRPTNIPAFPGKLQLNNTDRDGEKLYDLIWRRFVACQMAASIYDETKITVDAKNDKHYYLRASGQVMKFDGWRKIMKGKTEEDVVPLPDARIGDILDLVKLDPQQKFTQPPARFNESSLIKTLESLGIGRPSTYAPIITTIQARQYVEKEEGKFFPTPVGTAVTEFLVKNFPQELDYTFTAKMEDDLDSVANGKTDWHKEISDFWQPFSLKLDKVDESSKRVKIEVEKLGRKCPDCKEGDLVIRIGRFGKFISCSRFPECKHTEKFVEKLKMKCPDCGKGDIVVKATKRKKKFYGCSRYPDCKWASWKKPTLGNKAENSAVKV